LKAPLPQTPAQWQAWALGRDLARADANALLKHALKASATWLIAHSDDVLDADANLLIDELFCARLAGQPVAYLVGEREFYGLSIAVDASVLIPRPETEMLVDYLVQHVPKDAVVADVGTGSGAIAIALAHTRQDVQVLASDISQGALLCAQRNARFHGLHMRIEFFCSDVFAEFDWLNRRFHAIASNPPYIAQGDQHLSQGDLRFEPNEALTDGADGLRILAQLVQHAPTYLLPNGFLVLEHGFDQGTQVRALCEARGAFGAIQTERDLAGCERMTIARLK
jgi:release factor glutamine methyltransferase